MSGIGGAFSGVLGWFTNFLIIFFIGLYGAMEPEVYKRGFLRLIPKPRRIRVAQVLSEINETLKWWLIGKFFGMAVIGVFTTIGLWLLGIPLALILGLIAAILTFIPNIGPILALAPALLFGLTVSPEQALYVALLYIGIQAVESYVLTPLVQRKTIELPPALTLATQVFLGVSLGGLGVALATPLTAVGVVATKMLYVEDGLEDPIDGRNSK
jgi:predicted PurR-regulated permease PerM